MTANSGENFESGAEDSSNNNSDNQEALASIMDEVNTQRASSTDDTSNDSSKADKTANLVLPHDVLAAW